MSNDVIWLDAPPEDDASTFAETGWMGTQLQLSVAGQSPPHFSLQVSSSSPAEKFIPPGAVVST